MSHWEEFVGGLAVTLFIAGLCIALTLP